MRMRFCAWLLVLFATAAIAAGERHRLVAGDLVVELVVNDASLEAEKGPRFASTARVIAVQRAGLPFLVAEGMPDEISHDGEGTTGFAEAAAGGGFLKVGVGLLQREHEAGERYDAYWRYPVRERAVAVVTSRDESSLAIETRHAPVAGVALTLGQVFSVSADGRLTIDYWLRNDGTAPWRGRHYNHHFFAIAGRRADERYSLQAQGVPPVTPRVHRGWDITGPVWRLMRWPSAGRAASVVFERGQDTELNTERAGFSLAHDDGGRITVQSSHAVTGFTAWADYRSVCPELFVTLEVGPGETTRWQTDYRFEP